MNKINKTKKWKKWKIERKKNKPNYDETQNPGKCRGWSEIKTKCLSLYQYLKRAIRVIRAQFYLNRTQWDRRKNVKD